MQKGGTKRPLRPLQKQTAPGIESRMRPQPVSGLPKVGELLSGKAALISGGNSGIGRAVAVAFAQEGCDVAIAYRNEHDDARTTRKIVEAQGRKCVLIPGDLSLVATCRRTVQRTMKEFGRLDVLIHNAAVHTPRERPEDITPKQLRRTFDVNFFAAVYLVQAALPFLKRGASIICTTSVTAYRGSAKLVDYAASKGALVSFTRSLSAALNERGIRVNAVAPGPVWTPLIASSFPPKEVARFGSEVPMERAAEPVEIAPCYVFLASEGASYITGQVLHPNGGEVVNG